jgi:hypothetical protein
MCVGPASISGMFLGPPTSMNAVVGAGDFCGLVIGTKVSAELAGPKPTDYSVVSDEDLQRKLRKFEDAAVAKARASMSPGGSLRRFTARVQIRIRSELRQEGVFRQSTRLHFFR